MDINKFTQKSQEALQDAQSKAVRFGNNEVDIDHVLLSLIEQEGGIDLQVLGIGVNTLVKLASHLGSMNAGI